jgi:hypothetical protein
MAARSFCCFIEIFLNEFQGSPLERSITGNAADDRKEVPANVWSTNSAVHAPPAAFPDLWNRGGFLHSRPIYGLARQNASPSHDCSQWHIDASTLAYRCGGSTGFSPVSRLTG